MQQLVCLLPSCRSGSATAQSANTSKEKSNANVAMDFIVQCGVSEHDSELSSIVLKKKERRAWLPKIGKRNETKFSQIARTMWHGS